MNGTKFIIDIVLFLIILNIFSIAGYILLASNLFTRLQFSVGNQQIDDFIKVPNFYFEKLVDFIYKKVSN